MLKIITILVNITCLFILSVHASNDDEWSEHPSRVMMNIPLAITVSPEDILPKQARSTTYGALDVLPRDLIGRHIFTYCDNKILQANTSFFTLGTGYPSDHILDQDFAS